MIDKGIINSLVLSYKQEIVDKAVKKLESKISDGSFKNPENSAGVMSYLQQMCESFKREPQEKHESYQRYFQENIFTELVKQNGPEWHGQTLKKIKDLPENTIREIITRAKSTYWYSKSYYGATRAISAEEAKTLKKMYARINKKPESKEEKDLDDRIKRMESEIKNKATSEAAAVVYELYYKKELEMEL